MPIDVMLLILRIAIVVALYVFLGMILAINLQELRQKRETAASPPSARLIVIESDGVPLEPGQEFPLRPLTTLGRSPACTIVLPETFASTEHARISWRQEQWWLEDRDSRNGTELNGIAVTTPVVLSSKDVIGIGRIKLRFEAR